MQKQVTYVTIWVMTTGDASITMRHYKDFSLTPVLERTYLAQPPDAAVLPTLDKTVLGLTTYQKERLVPLRDSVAHMSAASHPVRSMMSCALSSPASLRWTETSCRATMSAVTG